MTVQCLCSNMEENRYEYKGKATDQTQSYVAKTFPDLPRETVRFEVSSIGCAVALEKFAIFL